MSDGPSDEQRRSMLTLMNKTMLELMLTLTEDRQLAQWIREELQSRKVVPIR